jgi:hypothetical protein
MRIIGPGHKEGRVARRARLRIQRVSRNCRCPLRWTRVTGAVCPQAWLTQASKLRGHGGEKKKKWNSTCIKTKNLVSEKGTSLSPESWSQLNAIWCLELDPGTKKGHEWKNLWNPNKVWSLINCRTDDVYSSVVECSSSTYGALGLILSTKKEREKKQLWNVSAQCT